MKKNLYYCNVSSSRSNKMLYGMNRMEFLNEHLRKVIVKEDTAKPSRDNIISKQIEFLNRIKNIPYTEEEIKKEKEKNKKIIKEYMSRENLIDSIDQSIPKPFRILFCSMLNFLNKRCYINQEIEKLPHFIGRFNVVKIFELFEKYFGEGSITEKEYLYEKFKEQSIK